MCYTNYQNFIKLGRFILGLPSGELRWGGASTYEEEKKEHFVDNVIHEYVI
jgi:hypothetical protein